MKTTFGRLLALAIALLALATTIAACGNDDAGSTTTTGAGAGAAATHTTAADDAATTTTDDAATREAKLPEPTKATLVLDFVPNAIHAGIYRALAAGYYRDRNIDLKVIQPTSTADTLRLINAGKADFGLADGLDVAGQIDRGLDIEAVMAITQRPLGGVITRAEDRIASAKDLEGKTVGITGVPSDNAVLDTIVANAGGDPRKVKLVTIGFNGVQNLESGKIAGFTGYWPADGTQVDVDGTPTKAFKLDESGGPVYPGLVAFSTREHIADDPQLVRAFAAATVAGYEDAIRDPQQALGDLLAQNRELRRDITSAQLDAYEPLFQGDAARFGTLDPRAIGDLSAWMLRNRLARAPFTAVAYGGDDYLPAAGGS
jgi:NitT/TauT family transport system substrate-binding protein/putative hydroxymethylpyrimidine transport system substrate-binding protein